MNAMLSGIGLSNHMCGSISGSSSVKNIGVLSEGPHKTPVRMADLRAKVESLLEKVQSCKDGKSSSAGLAMETSSMLTEHSAILPHLAVKKDGAKTDGYMALLEARADLGALDAHPCASSGAC